MKNSFNFFLSSIKLSFLILLLTACNESPPYSHKSNTDNTIKDSIEWHTNGIVSKDSDIRVIFKNPIVDRSMVGASADSFFSIHDYSSKNMIFKKSALRKKVAGKAIFKSPSEIVFKPDEPFEPTKKYSVTLKSFKKTQELKGKPSSFNFRFQVITLEHEI